MSESVTFAKFYSCNPEGGLASRFGTPSYIGAERDSNDPRRIVFNPKAVVGITTREYARYHKEYEKAVRGGSLVERSEADLVAYLRELEAPASESVEPESEAVSSKKKQARK